MTTDAPTDAPVDVATARAELAATIDAIQDRLDLPKQARLAVKRAKRRVKELSDEKPEVLVAAAVGAAAVIGGAVWLVVRAVRK